MASDHEKPPFKAPYMEDSQKRVRVLFGGEIVVDTYKPKLVWEHPFYPTYFFSSASELPGSKSKFVKLRKSEQARPEEGTTVYDLLVRDRVAKDAVTTFAGEGKYKELVGLFKIQFASADAWFEEDERIYVHAKDPYKRIDVLQSSRHVRIEVNGVELANTHRPYFLHETSLRRRTYIPIMDTHMEYMTPSDTVTACPYKGWANYFDVQLPSGEVHKDIVWYYRTPTAECAKIAGLLAFYDEKVTIWVDGVKQESVTKSEGSVTESKSSGGSRRPPSAYMFFSQEWRERIKAENPDASFSEVGKLLGAKWMGLDEDEKKPYIAMAAESKERAEKEKAE